MAVDRDRLQEANEAIDRRARQREAAALAQLEWNKLTPEQQAATTREIVGQVVEEDSEALSALENEGGPATGENTLQARLELAAQEVLEQASAPEPFALGAVVMQWILVPSDEDPTGWQLAVQLQVDDSTPSGVVYDIPAEMLDRWVAGEGLQRNHAEHKRFAKGLIGSAIELGQKQTTDLLTYALTSLIIQHASGEPTRTSVGDDEYFSVDESDVLYGDDGEPLTFEQVQALHIEETEGPFADAPENADEVPEG